MAKLDEGKPVVILTELLVRLCEIVALREVEG